MKKALVSGLVGVSLLSGFSNTNLAEASKKDINFNLDVSGGINLTQYTVKGDEIQTIPFHPSDGGAERGNTLAEIKDEQGFNATIHLGGSVGTKNFKLKGGIEGRIHPDVLIEKRKRENLPLPYDSYASSILDLNKFGYSPYIGVEANFGNWFLSAEQSFPKLKGEIITTQERYNQKNIINQYSFNSRGNGTKFALGIGNKESSLGVFYKNEKFDIGNKNEIKAKSYGLFLRHLF
jgi:hypothetical protein